MGLPELLVLLVVAIPVIIIGIAVRKRKKSLKEASHEEPGKNPNGHQ